MSDWLHSPVHRLSAPGADMTACRIASAALRFLRWPRDAGQRMRRKPQSFTLRQPAGRQRKGGL